jgi:hypothetical protein
MTEKQVGGSDFHYVLNNARNSATSIRNALSKFIETQPGPQTSAMLVAQMAVELSKITDAINVLEKIGAQEKKETQTTKTNWNHESCPGQSAG